MFSIFKRIFAGSHAIRPDPTYGIEVCSEEQLLREHFSPSEEQIQALGQLVQLVANPLGEAASSALAYRITSSLEPGQTTTEAFLDGTQEVDGEHRLLSIFVDWKAWDQIAWQTNMLLDAHGVTDRWTGVEDRSDWTGVRRGQETPVVLLELDSWLDSRGFCLLHVDTSGDDYLGFIVMKADSPNALHLATEAGLTVRTSSDFRSYCGL